MKRASLADANADIARMLPIWLEAWPVPPGMVDRQAAGLVLLIACANVANLMLVRSDSWRQEFALRTALGAGRGRLAREVLTESTVLALAGGALGVVLAQGGMKILVATAPSSLPRLEAITLDPRVVVFAVVISCAASVLCGAIPALNQAARGASPLAGTARGASAGRERQRVRNALVVV